MRNRLPTHASPVIQPMMTSMLSDVVACHRLAFAGYLNNRLGPKYLHAFFQWFCETENAIALCAVDAGCIAGYVVGAPLGYNNSLTRRLAYAALPDIIMRPQLLLDRSFVQKAVVKLQELGGRTVPDDAPDLPPPTYSLVGIATHPDYCRRGAATRLIETFEERALAAGALSLRLSVYRDNKPARRLYARSGWRCYPRDGNRGDYYHKVLSVASARSIHA
jgi:ribosomal protein S18 acetylase RimI-like enzyme